MVQICACRPTTIARRMPLASRTVAALTLAAALAVPAPALALAPGVNVDPGSPAGKEYSFPLSVLRAAGVGRQAPAGAAEPLFGVGITPAVAPARVRLHVRASSAGDTARSGRRSVTRRRTARRRTAPGARPAAPPGAGAGSEPGLARLAAARPITPQVALITAALLFAAFVVGGALQLLRRRRNAS